jgi:endonuclease/exonuclease/phosphatase family metal-dependent hydrolase
MALAAASAQPARDRPVSVRVMTYNIRYENPGDTGAISWPRRKAFILSTIEFHRPGIIGMQEVLHSQLAYFDSALITYAHAGVGREDGKEKGEYAPVYYDRSRYQLQADSTFWLSPEPGRVSRGWDAALERICTWVKLSEKRSGRTFFVFNTHFDHRGAVAREESARLLLSEIRRIAGDRPVILTGDLNCGPASVPIAVLTGPNEKTVPLLADAMMISDMPHHGSVPTFCGFNVRDGVVGGRIDYIFVTHHFSVRSHATLTDFAGDHFPSDHFPVLSDVQF